MLREKLGIPGHAKQVIVFGESSHWDPNWLLTSEGYFNYRVRHVLDKALEELTKEPRRIFSVECVFFLQMYWDRRPEMRGLMRDLINEGRLRLTGSGITTPDTLLPLSEAIIRDYLMGQEWLRANGMDQEPGLAYLPDDFGHSPGLPALLQSLGYDRAVVTRIDGSFFPGCDFRLPRHYPLGGSSAEVLSREHRTADFLWRSPDGSQVLCHWNPFTYCQGDMLTSFGVARWMGMTYGIPSRGSWSVARRINRQARKLSPLCKTPYLFCPIGSDFVSPIKNLVALLDRYNETSFAETGIFALNAALDDYLDLVGCHMNRLPVLDLDLNPYWMGFYAARPEIKQRCRGLTEDLLLVEKAMVAQDRCKDPVLFEELDHAWHTVAVSNHHDFITGTSPDRVWRREQRPWLVEAQARADRMIGALATDPAEDAVPGFSVSVPRWSFEDGKLLVQSSHYEIELDESLGGAITRWSCPEGPANLLSGLGNELISFYDSGGLWRMGHEYKGGAFQEKCRARDEKAAIHVAEEKGLLMAEVRSVLEGRIMTRRLWFNDASPWIRMSIQGFAGRRRTLTCRFPTALQSLVLSMDVPGGVVDRPSVKIYTPTFWPAMTFAHVRDVRTDAGMAVLMGGPASISGSPDGIIEWICLRNAPKERAFGFLPILACPAKGLDPDEHTLDYAVRMTTKGDWRENRIHVAYESIMGQRHSLPGKGPITVDHEDVVVSAVKPADRGDGVIVRLTSYSAEPCKVRLCWQNRPIRSAKLCDGRERDSAEVTLEDGCAIVPVFRAITSVRVVG